MDKYMFEIQNCINIDVDANNAEEARKKLINNPSLYQDELIKDCYISDGRKVIE